LHRFDTIVTDGQTNKRTPRPWLRRAKHSAIAGKNGQAGKGALGKHLRIYLYVSKSVQKALLPFKTTILTHFRQFPDIARQEGGKQA